MEILSSSVKEEFKGVVLGDIMAISRLRMGTDGKGVSTLVAFFDCPLHCRYCINDFCHGDANDLSDGAKRATYSPKQLMKVFRKDDIYFKMSGGGIVFGGGEPLLQSSFIHEVCKLADPMWNKRIETSLNVPWQYVEPLVEDIDEWIIDIKDINTNVYKNYTGVDNKQVLDNLLRMREMVDRSKMHIRIPRIPGFNSEENIGASVRWIYDSIRVEPEIFDYIVIENPDSAYDTDGEFFVPRKNNE